MATTNLVALLEGLGKPRERKPHPRVAIVTNRPAPYRKELFDRLAESWDLELFFTARHSTNRYWPRDQQMNLGTLSWHKATSPIALWKGIRDRGFDCVISWFGGRATLMAVTYATRACRTPFVLCVDMWEFPRTVSHLLARPLEIRMLRSADAIIANGTHMSTWVERVTGRRAGIFTAPHAVDNAAFRAPIDQSALKRLRENIGLDGGPVCLYVGRFEPEKGVLNLLAAIEQVPEVRLLAIGAGSLSTTLRNEVDKRGLTTRVKILEWVDPSELPAYYALGDFLVVPSVSTREFKEPWGLVANEAMNAGLPILCTTAVGAAEGGLVLHERTGLVVPERAQEALVAGIARLSGDVPLRKRLGEEARTRVLKWNSADAARAYVSAVEYSLEHGR